MSLKKTTSALVLLLVSQTAFANDKADAPPPPPPEPTYIDLIIQMLTPGGTYQPPP